MKKAIATPSRTKQILDEYGLYPRKGYGQNFLIDESVTRKIAQAIDSDSAVVEIGPGLGALSEQLANHVAYVKSFEIDERFISVLNEQFKDYSNIDIVEQDILELDLESEFKALKKKYGKVSVAANLPYYITSPVLFSLFEVKTPIDQIIVMVQKEVGDRFASKPNSPDYGALSVEGQVLFDIHKLCTVSKKSFIPAPKVDSVVIQFVRKETPLVNDVQGFFEFVKACFKQRRKTLYNNLKEYFNDDQKAQALLEKCHLKENVRAQELSVEEFIELYRGCDEK